MSTSAARMASEAERFRSWRPAASAVARAVAAAGESAALPKRAAQASKVAVVAKTAPQLRSAPVPARTAKVQIRSSQTRSFTVTINEGQTLWSLSRAHGVSVASVLEANGLRDANRIRAGTRLVIPGQGAVLRPAPAANVQTRSRQTTLSQSRSSQTTLSQSLSSQTGSLTVTLHQGQTLWSLARAHGVSVEAIVQANGLRNANTVRAGTRLVIPGRAASSPARRVTTARVTAPGTGATFTKAASTTAVRIARGFLWPARGLLTSGFGWRRWRHHDGIDIAAPYGSAVYAARPGRVISAGWYYAYGRTAIVDHGNGVQTLYGHASKLLVGPGQTVRQGQLIALVGATGRATGPHLHFEVRVNGKPVNPMRYMN